MLILGWLLIGIVFVLIMFNTTIICYNLFTACKLYYLRYKNRVAIKKANALKSKGKVLPASTKADNDIVEESERESPADLESYIKVTDQKSEQSKRNIPLLMLSQLNRDTPIDFHQDGSFDKTADLKTAMKK